MLILIERVGSSLKVVLFLNSVLGTLFVAPQVIAKSHELTESSSLVCYSSFSFENWYQKIA